MKKIIFPICCAAALCLAAALTVHAADRFETDRVSG